MRATVILVIVLALLVSGCVRSDVTILEGVEVREYQGEQLSSVRDFRENSIRGPQFIDIGNYTLEIAGLVENPLNLTYGEVLDRGIYAKVVTLYCVEGWSAKILWEGVLLKELLEGAGVKPEADMVIFHAYDGYATSLPLDYVVGNDIILAHRMNNVTLPPERGYPFQLVAEQKWGYKWIKWVTRIELSDDPAYRGFWESRGYSNTGNTNESMFG